MVKVYNAANGRPKPVAAKVEDEQEKVETGLEVIEEDKTSAKSYYDDLSDRLDKAHEIMIKQTAVIEALRADLENFKGASQKIYGDQQNQITALENELKEIKKSAVS